MQKKNVTIHPTAIIGDNVQLDDDVQIGPYAILDGEICIGRRTKILSYVHITGCTEIGEDNEIHMGAVIGNTPQDVAFSGMKSYTRIGNKNIIREFCTIHRGTVPDSETRIGNGNYLMVNSHVAHNCVLGNQIVMANGALLAGWVTLEDHIFVGGNSAVHQFCRIGKNAMIGGLSRVIKDVAPYLMCEGNSFIRGINTVGLKRTGYSFEERNEIKTIFKKLYLSGLNVSQFLSEIDTLGNSLFVEEYKRFIADSKRGLCRYQPSSKKRETDEEE